MRVYLAVNIPAADVRPFLPGPACRLPRPEWPDPKVREPGVDDFDHLPGFGVVERRRRGGLGSWSGEHAYALAARAVRFVPGLGDPEGPGGAPLAGVRVATRRFFSDGTVCRLELGFSFRGNRPVEPVVGAIAAMEVSVPALPGGRSAAFPLVVAPSRVFRNYLRLTVPSEGGRRSYEPWWCEPGTPLVVVEYDMDFGPAVLPDTRADLPAFSEHGIGLSFSRIRTDVREMPVWMIGKGSDTDLDALRRLRIILVRLHTEWETLAAVVRLVDRHRIEVDDSSDATVALRTYLKQATRVAARESRYGFEQSALQRAAQRVFAGAYEERVAAVLGRFEHIQDLVESRLERQRRQVTEARCQINNYINGDYVEDNSTNQEINVGGDNTGEINVVAAEQIENSFNKVSQARPEIQQDLVVLHEQVKEILPKLSPKQQADVLRSLETLTEEAAKEEPDERWYTVSGEGLIEAATNIGKAAEPIVKTVTKILGLLGA